MEPAERTSPVEDGVGRDDTTAARKLILSYSGLEAK
jgi:hypothetical protein